MAEFCQRADRICPLLFSKNPTCSTNRKLNMLDIDAMHGISNVLDIPYLTLVLLVLFPFTHTILDNHQASRFHRTYMNVPVPSINNHGNEKQVSSKKFLISCKTTYGNIGSHTSGFQILSSLEINVPGHTYSSTCEVLVLTKLL